jgi:DNA-binding MarR family transcriptional regulator
MVSPEQLGEQYLAVYHRMRRAVDEGMSACGLSLARTKILAHLQQGPARPGILAAGSGVAARTITDAVDGLERDGLVTRQADPTDRRASLVALTSEGKEALAVAAASRERLLKLVFGALDADDRAAMARLLGALDQAAAALITGAGPDEPPGCALSNQERG